MDSSEWAATSVLLFPPFKMQRTTALMMYCGSLTGTSRKWPSSTFSCCGRVATVNLNSLLLPMTAAFSMAPWGSLSSTWLARLRRKLESKSLRRTSPSMRWSVLHMRAEFSNSSVAPLHATSNRSPESSTKMRISNLTKTTTSAHTWTPSLPTSWAAQQITNGSLPSNDRWWSTYFLHFD